jgi:hypothetical protein
LPVAVVAVVVVAVVVAVAVAVAVAIAVAVLTSAAAAAPAAAAPPSALFTVHWRCWPAACSFLFAFFVTGDRFYRLFHAVFPKPPLKSGPRNKNRCMGLTNFLGNLKTGFFGLGFASAKKLRF